MNKLPSRLAGVCSTALAAALLAVPGLANATGIKIYSYAVKFICEEDEGADVDTSINIHNPSLTGRADYKWKLVVPDGNYYVIASDDLSADQATSVECDLFDGATIDDINFADFEGFIVVLSKKPLDVVGVYEIEKEGTGAEDLNVVPVYGSTQTVAPAVWDSLTPIP